MPPRGGTSSAASSRGGSSGPGRFLSAVAATYGESHARKTGPATGLEGRRRRPAAPRRAARDRRPASERVGELLPPGGRLERLAPVVGDTNRIAVPQVGDADVAVDAAVAVVGAPFDHQGVAEAMAPADPEPQALEVGPTSAIRALRLITSPLCG